MGSGDGGGRGGSGDDGIGGIGMGESSPREGDGCCVAERRRGAPVLRGIAGCCLELVGARGDVADIG